jgi:hypothetical protein
MPDITLCTNDDCPKKLECYRFMAKPDIYQSVSHFKWDNGCEYYWEYSVSDNIQ